MQFENIIIEWKECRKSIARFDDYLLRLRLAGFLGFVFLFGAAAVVGLSQGGFSSSASEVLLFLIIAIVMFVLAVYVLDRYYERLLLMSVLRASTLEANRFGEFKMGLTTEIEFQKAQIGKGSRLRGLRRASHMVNLVYILILMSMAIEYQFLLTRIDNSSGYSLIFWILAVIVVLVCFSSHSMLREPLSLIARRAAIVESPVVLSPEEIMSTVEGVAGRVVDWLKTEDKNELLLVAAPAAARPFANDLLAKMRELDDSLRITHKPVRVVSTHDNESLEQCSVLYGGLTEEMAGGKMVLLVDELIDTGQTIKALGKMAKEAKALQVRSAVLVNKYADCQVKADFLGYDLMLDPNKLKAVGLRDYWLFGYGMDIDGLYREIRHIGWTPKYI